MDRRERLIEAQDALIDDMIAIAKSRMIFTEPIFSDLADGIAKIQSILDGEKSA